MISGCRRLRRMLWRRRGGSARTLAGRGHQHLWLVPAAALGPRRWVLVAALARLQRRRWRRRAKLRRAPARRAAADAGVRVGRLRVVEALSHASALVRRTLRPAERRRPPSAAVRYSSLTTAAHLTSTGPNRPAGDNTVPGPP